MMAVTALEKYSINYAVNESGNTWRNVPRPIVTFPRGTRNGSPPSTGSSLILDSSVIVSSDATSVGIYNPNVRAI